MVRYCVPLYVQPSTGASYSVPAHPCNLPGESIVMPFTTFVSPESGLCDAVTTVSYPITNEQISSMIRSTSGTCSQIVSVYLSLPSLSQ